MLIPMVPTIEGEFIEGEPKKKDQMSKQIFEVGVLDHTTNTFISF